MRLPGRHWVGSLVVGLALALVAVDLWRSAPIDPYQAPYPTALGSGQAPGVAHCTNITTLSE